MLTDAQVEIYGTQEADGGAGTTDNDTDISQETDAGAGTTDNDTELISKRQCNS